MRAEYLLTGGGHLKLQVPGSSPMKSVGAATACASVPSSEHVREQVGRILSSDVLCLSGRGRKFLQFVVDETLEGRDKYLKAFTIANQIFGRGTSFNAQIDPCVRIEANRIRRELERYYLLAGLNDEIIITLPKGRYVPAFANCARQPDSDPSPGLGRNRHLSYSIAAGVAAIIAAASSAIPLVQQVNYAAIALPMLMESRPTILVERFSSFGPEYRSEALSQSIPDAIIEMLAKSREIVVLVDLFPGTTKRRRFDPLYAVRGRVQLEGDHLRANVRLVRRVDGAVIWANNYDSNLYPQGIASVATSLAKDISAKIERSVAAAEER